MHYHWQDILLSVCILVFNLALLPSIFSKSKPDIRTSFITAVFMSFTVIAYISLSLWYTVIMSAINSLLWFILTFQKYNIKNK